MNPRARALPAAILATLAALKVAAPDAWSAGVVGTALLEALLASLWLHSRTARFAGAGTALLAVCFAAFAWVGWPAPARSGGCGCLGRIPVSDPGRLAIAGLLMAGVAVAWLGRAPSAADAG